MTETITPEWTADSTILHAQHTLSHALLSAQRSCESYQLSIEHHQGMLSRAEESLVVERANALQLQTALMRLSRSGVANL